jgi:trk system potassium uptake protein TrkH
MGLVRFIPVSRALGLLTIMFSASFIVPSAISLWTQDGEFYHLAASAGLILLIGFLLWFPARKEKRGLRNTDSFLIVGFFWIGLGSFGALPFMLGPHLGYVDSLFEAVSGFTTTGATVMVGLDRLPPSILFYRQQLQWFGGAGVILLAIAVLPLMGLGGMQLYRAEIPGPDKEKLAPRIVKTARYLWVIYIVLTAACALSYWLAGMSVFDAVAHSMSTLSTGGFSTHDASFAYYKSPAIEFVAQIFMLLGAINFAAHFRCWRQRSAEPYLSDVEVRTFVLIVAGTILVTSSTLYVQRYYPTFAESLRHASFHVISVITTTGYTTTGFASWPLALPVIYMFISFIGGCAGSTAGGMKVIRTLLLWKQGEQQLKLLIHPTMAARVKIGGRAQDERLMSSVWSFFSVYALTFSLLMILMMMTGENQVTAFSAIATCMNNLGPGLGKVTVNFTNITPAGKLIAVYAMLLGRLEIFTLLVLLTPDFWRR